MPSGQEYGVDLLIGQRWLDHVMVVDSATDELLYVRLLKRGWRIRWHVEDIFIDLRPANTMVLVELCAPHAINNVQEGSRKLDPGWTCCRRSPGLSPEDKSDVRCSENWALSVLLRCHSSVPDAPGSGVNTSLSIFIKSKGVKHRVHGV
jgi:hypothetical protein